MRYKSTFLITSMVCWNRNDNRNVKSLYRSTRFSGQFSIGDTMRFVLRFLCEWRSPRIFIAKGHRERMVRLLINAKSLAKRWWPSLSTSCRGRTISYALSSNSRLRKSPPWISHVGTISQTDIVIRAHNRLIFSVFMWSDFPITTIN